MYITHFTGTCAAGVGLEELSSSLSNRQSALLNQQHLDGLPLNGYVGRVKEVDTISLPMGFADFDCRNNRLGYLALNQDNFLETALATIKRYGPSRVGVFIGTSTSGIAQTEAAYRESYQGGLVEMPAWYQYGHCQNIHSAGRFLCSLLGIRGPAYTISTACSSSAKVFAAASRALNARLCDAAIVGGVDSLCLTTSHGFHALQLISPSPCRPADIDRSGISIGEAAGFAIIEREKSGQQGYRLLGYGESSDAYHMSSPDPSGLGALTAMRQSLSRSGLAPDAVDYINLHGTGTKANDAAEDLAVWKLFADRTPCSSTKGWMGHCLGAAGILEAIISMLCIRHNWILPSLGTENVDPEFRSAICTELKSRKVRTVMSNSFGFGGTNCSLIFGESE